MRCNFQLYRFIGFNKISHENISGKRAASGGAGLIVSGLIGVWQQESGKGPRLANGAAYCVPDLTSHALPPWRALLGRPDQLGSRLPHLSAGKSGVGGERVV